MDVESQSLEASQEKNEASKDVTESSEITPRDENLFKDVPKHVEEDIHNRNETSINNKFFTLTKPDASLGYHVQCYNLCELTQDMHSIRYFDGTVVQRPSGTVFRPGQEVFLCPVQRSKAIGKHFLLLGVLPTNKKMPPLSHALLLDTSAFEMTRDLNNFNELNFFRATPLKHVAKVPGGGAFEETQDTLRSCEECLKIFFKEIISSKKDLNLFDFSETIPAIKPMTRGSVGKKKVPILCKDTTMEQQPATIVSTPPFAKKLIKQNLDLSKTMTELFKNTRDNKPSSSEASYKKIQKQLTTLTTKVDEISKRTSERERELEEENKRLKVQCADLQAQVEDLRNKNPGAQFHQFQPYGAPMSAAAPPNVQFPPFNYGYQPNFFNPPTLNFNKQKDKKKRSSTSSKDKKRRLHSSSGSTSDSS